MDLNCNFIEVYEDIISSDECEVLKQLFQISFHNSLSDGSVVSDIISKGLLPSIDSYFEKYDSLKYVPYWAYSDDYSFQKDQTEDTERILKWMLCLNNGSGIEFKHYPSVDAKVGRCIIWPAGWTHLYKIESKYFVTGGVSYVA